MCCFDTRFFSRNRLLTGDGVLSGLNRAQFCIPRFEKGDVRAEPFLSDLVLLQFLQQRSNVNEQKRLRI